MSSVVVVSGPQPVVDPRRARTQKALLAASHQYFQFAVRYPHFFRVLAFPWSTGTVGGDSDTADRLARRVDQQNERKAAVLQNGTLDGSLRPMDTRRTATLLWAAWNGVISLMWRTDALTEDAASVAELLERCERRP